MPANEKQSQPLTLGQKIVTTIFVLVVIAIAFPLVAWAVRALIAAWRWGLGV